MIEETEYDDVVQCDHSYDRRCCLTKLFFIQNKQIESKQSKRNTRNKAKCGNYVRKKTTFLIRKFGTKKESKSKTCVKIKLWNVNCEKTVSQLQESYWIFLTTPNSWEYYNDLKRNLLLVRCAITNRIILSFNSHRISE